MDISLTAFSQVLTLIEEQTRKVDQRIDALLLVGGFSGSEYLFKRVDVRLLYHDGDSSVARFLTSVYFQ